MRKRSTPRSFAQRLSDKKAGLLAQLQETKPGPQQDLLIGKLRQIETASQIDGWLTSKDLQPPK